MGQSKHSDTNGSNNFRSLKDPKDVSDSRSHASASAAHSSAQKKSSSKITPKIFAPKNKNASFNSPENIQKSESSDVQNHKQSSLSDHSPSRVTPLSAFNTPPKTTPISNQLKKTATPHVQQSQMVYTSESIDHSETSNFHDSAKQQIPSKKTELSVSSEKSAKPVTPKIFNSLNKKRSENKKQEELNSQAPKTNEVYRHNSDLSFTNSIHHPQSAHALNLPTVEEISSGGIIINSAPKTPEVAIIARYNRARKIEWCLPKGHPENQENYAEAAIREIEEETGIRGNIVAQLGEVDYWFTVDEYRVHKTVYHFLLEQTGGELTIHNDPDEEAIDAAWVPIDQLHKHLSFINEKKLVDMVIDMLDLKF